MEKIFIPLMCICLVVALSACSIINIATGADKQPKIKYVYKSFSDTNYNYSLGFEYWDLLSAQGKMYYDAIANFSFEVIRSYETNNLYHFDNADDYDPEDLDEAMIFYGLDHPENELVDAEMLQHIYGSNKEIFMDIVGISSLMDEAEYQKFINEIDFEIADLVEQVNQTEDKIEKYRLIHDWITLNVEYDNKYYDDVISGKSISYETNSGNIYGAIVEKKAVCDGIADAFKYICNKCNLECVNVPGDIDDTINEEYGHQWNIVLIDNNWYLVDCTFDLDGYSEYFLNENLEINGRVPKYYGIPGY